MFAVIIPLDYPCARHCCLFSDLQPLSLIDQSFKADEASPLHGPEGFVPRGCVLILPHDELSFTGAAQIVRIFPFETSGSLTTRKLFGPQTSDKERRSLRRTR